MIYQGKAQIPVKEVILHCAAINTGQFDGYRPYQVFATVNRWHLERGFKNGFGYHGLITPDGYFYSGRPLDMIGAHVIGRNSGTLGILLVESKKIDRLAEFETYYTKHQKNALKRFIDGLDGISKISGHNDYAPKLCPGFSVSSLDWL